MFLLAAEGLLDLLCCKLKQLLPPITGILISHIFFSLCVCVCVCVHPSVCMCVCLSRLRPGFFLLGRRRVNVASLCPPLLCPPCCRPIGAGKCAGGVLPLISALVAAPPMGRAAAGAYTGSSWPRQPEPPADLGWRGRRPAEVVHLQTRGPPKQGMIPQRCVFATFKQHWMFLMLNHLLSCRWSHVGGVVKKAFWQLAVMMGRSAFGM